MTSNELVSKIEEASREIGLLKEQVGRVIVGQQELVQGLCLGLLCEGHLLLEGVPGIAKTLAVNTVAQAISVECRRIQFTPDLLPSDLIGMSVFHPKEGTFSVQKGPVFTNIVLADEINRAPAKVQSALLEVMQEKQVTISGTTLKTGDPFMVLATQNPIEHEGTYPLPEAETDRFMMKILMDYPRKSEEKEIVTRMALAQPVEVKQVTSREQLATWKQIVNEVYVDQKIVDYVVNIVFATRTPKDYALDIGHFLEYGASPRASIWLTKAARGHAFLEGRGYVTPYDVKKIAPSVLRHRLILSYEAEAQEVSPDDIVQAIMEKVPVP